MKTRSTTICRYSGLAALAMIVGAWTWGTHRPAPAAFTSIDNSIAVQSRMVDQPGAKSEATPAADAKKADNKVAAGGKGEGSDARREQFRRQLEFNNRRQQMLERIWKEAGRHEPTTYERNHRSVKEAFRETVAATRGATVRVLADGKQVALGAVVRADGLIATKGSEAQGKLQCELADGRRLAAEKVAADETNDLVLLRVPAADLKTVSLASSDVLSKGSFLATCGTGVDPVAVGVVSVPAREIRPPRGILGVLLASGDGGARIEEVIPGSAAAQAGLVPGDRIVEINKHRVSNHDETVKVLKPLQAGDKVRLMIAREKEQIEMSITLGSVEMSGLRADRFQMMNMLGGPLSARRAGFTSAIQHDTILAPSECGGPVVDLNGRVVALNIARGGRVDSYAIPASVIEKLVKAQPAPAKTQAVSHKETAQH